MPEKIWIFRGKEQVLLKFSGGGVIFSAVLWGEEKWEKFSFDKGVRELAFAMRERESKMGVKFQRLDFMVIEK